jgi:hypothetical protein
MNPIVKKVLTYLILPAAIVGLTYANVKSVMKPVEFKKYKETHPLVPDTRIAEIVIYHPAPCFGLEPRVAGIIIRKMSKLCQQEKIRRLMLHF